MTMLPHEAGEMMDRLGIDAAERELPRLSLSFMTAFRRCDACPVKAACRDWLTHHHERLTLAPAFCPNSDVLFELKVNQPGARH